MKYKIKIKGITPYMQHRMDDKKLEEWEGGRPQIIERKGINHPDLVRAEYHAYVNEKGKYFLPSEHIRSAMITAGTYQKSKVGVRTKSMKSIVAAMFMVTPEEIPLPVFDQIDKRSAVNRNVKARVIVIRPKWTAWEAAFTLEVGESTLTDIQLKELINITGSYVGIGSYRPTNNGYFGRFELASFERA